jgi:hypothetical protein
MRRSPNEFLALLERMTPSERLVEVTAALFKKAWQQRALQAAAFFKACGSEIAKVQKEIDVVLNRLVAASSQSVVNAYERRVAELEKEKLVEMPRVHHAAWQYGGVAARRTTGKHQIVMPITCSTLGLVYVSQRERNTRPVMTTVRTLP